MNTSLVKSEFWHPHVEAKLASGKSSAAYAKANGLNLCQLRYWVAKHRPGRPAAFAAVRAEPSLGHLEVRLPGGIAVTVTSMADLDLLRGVVRALECAQ